LGAPERDVIGRAGKAQTTAMALAMARICNAAPGPEGGSNGCAALTRAVNRIRSKNIETSTPCIQLKAVNCRI
jgi:hypothetical protein